MRQSKLWRITVFLLLIIVKAGSAQTSSKPDPVKHESKVRDIVAFLEYVLNTLGDKNASARDKDVLITESYTKIFRDGKVQVEDDLVSSRNVITNKDVQAYLKDVDFFFDNVKFEFDIKEIKGDVNVNGKLFYKVSLTRNLQGTTLDGNPVNSTIPRFIEVNYDPESQDLKIVSIYTNEFDEKEALLHWWSQLSYEWQAIFKRKFNITDSASLNDIKNFTSVDTLNLSHNIYIQNIEPLTQLVNLKVLNLSETTISDISPIRNLTELVDLNLAGTNVKDISALRYSGKLLHLNLSHTKTFDITVIERMPALKHLELEDTDVTDFTPLRNLTSLEFLNLRETNLVNLEPLSSLNNLKELNASKTLITDLTSLKTLVNVVTLNLDSTRFADINALSQLKNLKVISLNYTPLSTLDPLKGLPNLEKVYCDQTRIKQDLANAFMAERPGVLVVFDSEDLKSWWATLNGPWQKIFTASAKISMNPSKEELAKVTYLDSVNIGGNTSIISLEPLQRLPKLKVLMMNKSGISDLSPLKGHKEISVLDISNTPVSDISILRTFSKLQELRADNSKIENIDPLSNLPDLQKVYVDHTSILDFDVQDLLKTNPNCLVVFKTYHLERWWGLLPDSWKEVFQAQLKIDPAAKRESLHKLVEMEKLQFQHSGVSDLAALDAFVRLKELNFSGTSVTDLKPLVTLTSLKVLYATNSPIRSIESLSGLTGLEEVDISNTPVDDLEPLENLQNLKKINCAGTQIKKLDALGGLGSLEFLDCSNTLVKNLGPVSHLSLKTLKCYNTKISQREAENFKASNPDCSIVYYR